MPFRGSPQRHVARLADRSGGRRKKRRPNVLELEISQRGFPSSRAPRGHAGGDGHMFGDHAVDGQGGLGADNGCFRLFYDAINDTLTGRSGLSLFVRYLRNIQIFQQIDTFFGSMRRSRKGQPITEIFKQLLCFFVDGTSRHLVYFDALAKDAGYAAATESEPSSMLSSHAVKRFFCSFWWPRIYLLRHLLQR